MIKSLQDKHQVSWIYFVRLIFEFSSPAQIRFYQYNIKQNIFSQKGVDGYKW